MTNCGPNTSIKLLGAGEPVNPNLRLNLSRNGDKHLNRSVRVFRK